MLRNSGMNLFANARTIGQNQIRDRFSQLETAEYTHFHLSSCIFHLPLNNIIGKLVCAVLLLVFSAAMTLPGPALAQNKNQTTVYVVGTGHIRGDDMSAGRQEAIDNGLVMAVSRALVDLMPAETLAGSFQVLNEMVFGHTDRFVQDYKVLAESNVSGTYRLLVQATVSTRRLKEALQKAGVRLGQIQFPRVLFCIAEKGIQDDAPRYWWSGRSSGDEVTMVALSKFFSEKGYVIVPAAAVGAVNYPPELSPAEAVAVGQQLKADIVVTGLASAEEAANTMGATVRSYRATLNATAYRVSDGLSIARVMQTALMADNNAISGSREALNSVAVMVGEGLTPQIGEAWFKQASSTTQIDIVVQGISGNIANFVKFRGALSNASGVDSLQLKEMVSGAAVLTVAYQGNADALADALLLLEFDTFGVDVQSVEGNTINMQLMPKQ